MTFNFDYTLSQFNDYFTTHKVNGSRSNGFLPDVYQIQDEVIWLTPEKGCPISTAPVCWEQIEPSQMLVNNLIIVIGNTWEFCLNTQCNHSRVFQPQFRSSLCLARQWMGLDISVMLACSKWDILDMWLLPMGMASPWLGREMNPRSSLYTWFYSFRASRKAC